jgi:hypothetical protein
VVSSALSVVITGLLITLLFMVALQPFAIPAAWRLFGLEGRSPPWALLLLIPYLGIIAVLVLLQRPGPDLAAEQGAETGPPNAA